MENHYGLIVFWLAFPLLLAFQARLGTMIVMFALGIGITVWSLTNEPDTNRDVQDTIKTMAVQPPVDPMPLPSDGEPKAIEPVDGSAAEAR